jgi:hypothetical protein
MQANSKATISALPTPWKEIALAYATSSSVADPRIAKLRLSHGDPDALVLALTAGTEAIAQ